MIDFDAAFTLRRHSSSLSEWHPSQRSVVEDCYVIASTQGISPRLWPPLLHCIARRCRKGAQAEAGGRRTQHGSRQVLGDEPVSCGAPLFQWRLPRRRSRPEYPVPNSGAILAATLVAHVIASYEGGHFGNVHYGTYRTIQWRPPLSAIREQRTTADFGAW